jgi:hypothetical protein
MRISLVCTLGVASLLTSKLESMAHHIKAVLFLFISLCTSSSPKVMVLLC